VTATHERHPIDRRVSMPRPLCFLVLLAVLAAGSGLAFAAAAAQAAGPPPPLLAAKEAGGAAAAAATPASGDGDSAVEAGNRIGSILKSWGTALLLGVAGLMGLTAIGRRSVGEGVTLLVVVLIVGGFVFAPDQVKGFVQSIWQPFSGQ
jgi:hypothetical protein